MKIFLLMLIGSLSIPVKGAPTAEKPIPVTAKKKSVLEKSPKGLFLIKKVNVGAEVGEPQFYPEEAQLRMVIEDESLQNLKKFQ